MPEMVMSVDAWGRSVNGREIDRDGSGNPRAQCWDLWADYAERAVGCPLAWTYTLNSPGDPEHFLASSVYTRFPTPREGDLSVFFDKIGPDQPAQAGDVAFWGISKPYPLTHTAIVTGPAVGGMLPCWTQNPGATRHEMLTMAGLLGYLRPKALAQTSNQTDQGDDEEMKNAGFWYKRNGKHINVITNAVSGFYHEFESANGAYNSGIARAYETGNFEEISASHADALRRDCALVRSSKA